MMRRIVISAFAVVGGLIACAELFDEPSQCKSDRDCTKFGGVCDVTRAVCVPAPTVPGDGGGATDGGGSTDAQEESPPPGCDVTNKETAEITGTAIDAGDSETASITLDCTKDWILKDRIFVKSGATLTIQPGTKIVALANSAIVVRPGAKIEAKGFRDQPIVFSSSMPNAGFWRGIFVLGQAPPMGSYLNEAAYGYGGTDNGDSSGTLEFVRIEYANDGLVFGGVGKGTKVDSVMVRRPGITQCFAMLGGRFDAKHLVCQYPLDEMIEIAGGYDGKLQFVFGHKAGPGGGHHGLFVDNSVARVSNVTMCGEAQNNQSYGFFFRNNARFDLLNGIFTGWGGGMDAVGNVGSLASVRTTVFANNTTNPAFIEVEAGPGETLDDDNGFDEIAFFDDGGTNTTDPANLVACHDGANPQPWPNAPITGTAPPNDGFFDSNANYIGAFKDANDAWMKGAWVKFTDP